MQQNNVLKGVILVGLGASFYGMLATFVKLAYKEGYTTAEVTTSQFVLGILGMLLLSLYQAKFSKKAYPSITEVTACRDFHGVYEFVLLSSGTIY